MRWELGREGPKVADLGVSEYRGLEARRNFPRLRIRERVDLFVGQKLPEISFFSRAISDFA